MATEVASRGKEVPIRLHRDNAPAHSVHSTAQYLAENHFELVPYPPYSPDVSPCDFNLFGLFKRAMGGRHFQSQASILI